VLGLVTAAMSAFFVVAASGFIALPERAHEDPRWVSALAGSIFLVGGTAVVVRGSVGINGHDPDGLRPSTPCWLRGIAQLMALVIVVCFGAIFSWIGFGRANAASKALARSWARHSAAPCSAS
jgi:hypothetical protein